MVTPFGRFLRKLRIDHNQKMRDMSSILGVTPSFLSNVERGIRPIPPKWPYLISQAYKFNCEQSKELERAIVNTLPFVKINLDGADDLRRKVAVAFARKLKDLNDSDIAAIQKILEEDEE